MAFPIGYSALLANSPADGTAVAATVTATSLLTGSAAAGKTTLPANWLGSAAGFQLKVYASGRISTPAATMGNPTFDIRFGSVIVATSPAFVSLASQTNITWRLEWDLTVRAVGNGTSANVLHTGEFKSALVSATNLMNLIPATAPVVGTGFDSTVSNTVDLFVTWSNATVGNTVQLHQYALIGWAN